MLDIRVEMPLFALLALAARMPRRKEMRSMMMVDIFTQF